jgi:signal transduction histidine kinase
MPPDARRHDFQADIDAIGRIDAVPTILDVICRTTGMGFAAVARVTEERWIACRVLDNIDFGLHPGGELDVESTICHEIREHREAVVIDHVAEDAVYCGHSTPARYGFQSYISMPIVHKDGKFFGTLCAIDPRPNRLRNPETIGMLRLFAELIAAHLDSDESLRASQAALREEKHLSLLREQFIAVLGHDLRNPLASISAGIRLLQKESGEERRHYLTGMIEGSVRRMAGLIDNVLDFARGRLGAGIPVELRRDVRLLPVLDQVVSEMRVGNADRVIVTDFQLSTPVKCDPSRIGQLVSNLLGNAVTHGAPDQPVRIDADVTRDMLTISVVNGGEPIEPAAMDRLFQPFFRGDVRHSQQGLGLGLHIASEIAKAHGGTLTASSTAQETRFVFRMPATPA